MAISKVVYKSSPSATGETWMDVTGDSVTAGTLLSGETATQANGVRTTGTYTAPVTDVQVNGLSVVSNTVASISVDPVVAVAGSTPSITGAAGTRYVCGEVSTLTVTFPSSGDVEVIFESGATATVLTVTPPSGVTAIKWTGNFDPTSLDANTVYDIIVTDGKYGVSAKWA